MDFQQLSNKLRGDLALPDAEDTWERVAKAITTLKQACEARQFADAGDVVQSIRSFHSSITHAMNSERTRLCLAALDLIDAVAIACETRFEPLVPVFLPALLAVCARTNKVIVNKTKICIIRIIENTQLASVLPYFLNQLSERATTARLIAVEGALVCINCCNPPDLEKESRASEIETIIRKAARDASAEVRKVGREIFGAYKILLPDRVERFTAPLTPTIKKYLDIKPGDPSKPLLKVKSMSSLTAARLESVPKASSKHSRTASVTTSTRTTVTANEPIRSRPASRVERLPTNPQSAIRQSASAAKQPDARIEHPKKLVSQSGAAGPSRVIPRPGSGELRQAVVRPNRAAITSVQRPLTRPTVASSSQQLNSSGPRRVPLPPSSSGSQSQVADKVPVSRPNSQQSRHVPGKAVEKPTITVSRVSRPAVAAAGPRAKTPVERVPKVRAGLSQPTLSQMAKMRTNVVRKAPTTTVVKPSTKVSSNKSAQGTQATAILRDGAPRSNAAKVVEVVKEPEEAPVATTEEGPQLAGEQEEQQRVPEHVEEEAVVELLEVIAQEEDDEDEVEEPTHRSLPTISEPVEGTVEEEIEVEQEPVVVVSSGEDEEEVEVQFQQDGPITPPGPGYLGVAWNGNNAKTPISTLLTSIQQGFEFSPASPLSPPQGYHNGHQKEALALF